MERARKTSYSKENLQYLTVGGYRFVIALPGSLKYVRELIGKHGQGLVNHSEYLLGPGLPYGKSFESEALGFRMRVHLYYDPEKALRESTALHELLEAQENDLRGMEEPPDRKQLRSHSTQTEQGKIFVSFFALIVQAYLLKQLKEDMRKNNLTLRNILLELDKMKTIQYPGSQQPRLLNPLTKRQREIYELLESYHSQRIGIQIIVWRTYLPFSTHPT